MSEEEKAYMAAVSELETKIQKAQKTTRTFLNSLYVAQAALHRLRADVEAVKAGESR